MSSVWAGDVRSRVRLQMLCFSLRRGLNSVDDQLHFWPSNSSRAVHKHGTDLPFHEESWLTSMPCQMLLDRGTLMPRAHVSGADRMSTFDLWCRLGLMEHSSLTNRTYSHGSVR